MSVIKKREITIAVIGLIGVLATAIFSNWDKIFLGKGELRADYTGYKATGDFETELRYFFEVSGTRKMVEAERQQMLSQLRMQLISESPEDAKEIDAMIDVISEEAITLDEEIKEFLPVYQKHFTVEEIQELNKFYSTEIMQNFVRKLPLIAQDAAPIQIEMLKEYINRIATRLD